MASDPTEPAVLLGPSLLDRLTAVGIAASAVAISLGWLWAHLGERARGLGWHDPRDAQTSVLGIGAMVLVATAFLAVVDLPGEAARWRRGERYVALVPAGVAAIELAVWILGGCVHGTTLGAHATFVAASLPAVAAIGAQGTTRMELLWAGVPWWVRHLVEWGTAVVVFGVALGPAFVAVGMAGFMGGGPMGGWH